MPTYDATIEDFTVGDDLDIVRNVSAIPSGQTVTEAWLTIKVYEAGASILLQKNITTVLSADGVITNGTGTAELTFTLSATDTALLSPGNYHYYDIQLETSAGKIYTPEKGRIKGEIGIT